MDFMECLEIAIQHSEALVIGSNDYAQTVIKAEKIINETDIVINEFQHLIDNTGFYQR